MRKIKSGDVVMVIAGKDKGETGKVLSVVEKGTQVIVEGMNIKKKHVRANPQAGVEGGIVEKSAPIHISNVALVNPATGKPEKVGIRILENGKKVRYFKKSNQQVDA